MFRSAGPLQVRDLPFVRFCIGRTFNAAAASLLLATGYELDMSAFTDYLPFAARDGWRDVVPIPQADPPNALVPIAYSEQCEHDCRWQAPEQELTDGTNTDRDAMDTFRAIVAKDELSERVLELTEVLIRINPGHFTVWWVLRDYGRQNCVLTHA